MPRTAFLLELVVLLLLLVVTKENYCQEFVPKKQDWRLLQSPPLLIGFSHYPKKEELYIYWNVWVFAAKDTERYTVNASTGLMASKVGINFAVFSDWNPKLPANVTLWSENSLERSLNVPILTNADRRQPRNVWYDDNITSISWDDPIEKNGLIGYTLHWCRMCTINSRNCDSRIPMRTYSLEQYRNHFQFGSSMARHNIAVEADYSDGISGGMTWSVPGTKRKDPNILAAIIGSAMIILAIFFVLGVIIFKKLRHNNRNATAIRENNSPGEMMVNKQEEKPGVIIEHFYLTMKPIPRDLTLEETHVPPPYCPLSSDVIENSPDGVEYTLMSSIDQRGN